MKSDVMQSGASKLITNTPIAAQLTDFDRLVFGLKKLDFLNPYWLEECMADAHPRIELSDMAIPHQLLPALPISPTWIAQAWSLYTRHSLENEETTQRNVSFLHFILGLQEAWPKQTAFSHVVMRTAMMEGAKRAAQILKIVYIFHEDSGVLRD